MKTIKVQMDDLSKNTGTPVLSYCRKLIKEGVDPNTRLEVYRRNKTEFDIAVKSIGEGAKLTVVETAKEGPRLKLYKEYRGPNKNIGPIGVTPTPKDSKISVKGISHHR